MTPWDQGQLCSKFFPFQGQFRSTLFRVTDKPFETNDNPILWEDIFGSRTILSEVIFASTTVVKVSFWNRALLSLRSRDLHR